jgi:hypothetical protein
VQLLGDPSCSRHHSPFFRPSLLGTALFNESDLTFHYQPKIGSLDFDDLSTADASESLRSHRHPCRAARGASSAAIWVQITIEQIPTNNSPSVAVG